jgi:hypothetical protein
MDFIVFVMLLMSVFFCGMFLSDVLHRNAEEERIRREKQRREN